MHKSHSVRLARKARRRRHGAQAGSLSPGWREAPVKARVPQQRLWTTMRCERERSEEERNRGRREVRQRAHESHSAARRRARHRAVRALNRETLYQGRREVCKARVSQQRLRKRACHLTVRAPCNPLKSCRKGASKHESDSGSHARKARPTRGKSPKEEHDACASDSASVTARVSQQRLCTRDTPNAPCECERELRPRCELAADLQ